MSATSKMPARFCETYLIDLPRKKFVVLISPPPEDIIVEPGHCKTCDWFYESTDGGKKL